MFERIHSMLIKEFIQVFRDPKMKPIIFVMPVVQLLIFGYAATTDVKHIVTGVYDLDNTVESRDLLSRFRQSKYFDFTQYVQTDQQAQDLMDSSRVQVILRINHGFAQQLRGGNTGQVQILIDGTDSNIASIVLNYSSKIVSEFSQTLIQQRFNRMGAMAREPPQMTLESRAWFNENLESRNFYVPGVMAMLVLITTLMLTGMAIVREREIGTMEQIMVTPIRRWEFILGKTVPFVLIGFLDVLIITAVGVFWFDVPIRGSLALLLFCTALFLMTSIGAGLLISTVCSTQQQALMTTFFFSLPAILLSGFMFPIANMPPAVQWLTYLDPMRYFLIIIRSIFLKGVGVEILWPQMLGLVLLGLATLTLATKRFHKTI